VVRTESMDPGRLGRSEVRWFVDEGRSWTLRMKAMRKELGNGKFEWSLCGRK
jgi:hypothetical protein